MDEQQNPAAPATDAPAADPNAQPAQPVEGEQPAA